jgi:hypothetical protein
MCGGSFGDVLRFVDSITEELDTRATKVVRQAIWGGRQCGEGLTWRKLARQTHGPWVGGGGVPCAWARCL